MTQDQMLAAAADASYSTNATWRYKDVHVVRTDYGNTTILACRGTVPSDITDWERDFSIEPIFDNNFGVCHSGFLSGARGVSSMVLPQIQGRNVWLCGHSLGGALAICLAAILVNQKIPVSALVTFGAPRAGRSQLRAALAGVTVRQYHDGNDPVPALVWPYQHMSDLIDIGVPVFGGISDHSMTRYRALISNMKADNMNKLVGSIAASAMIPFVVLTGCTVPGVPQPTVSQIAAQDVADAQSVIVGLTSTDAVLKTMTPPVDPAKLTAFETALAGLKTTVNNFSQSVTPTLTEVQAFEAGANAAISAASSIPGIPPQVTAILTAASILLPVIEATVNQQITTASATDPVTVAKARATLLQPVGRR